MKEALIVLVSFFSGMFLSLILYEILCLLVGYEDKVIIFKKKRKSKTERIKLCEDRLFEIEYKIRHLEEPIILCNECFERNKKK